MEEHELTVRVNAEFQQDGRGQLVDALNLRHGFGHADGQRDPEGVVPLPLGSASTRGPEFSCHLLHLPEADGLQHASRSLQADGHVAVEDITGDQACVLVLRPTDVDHLLVDIDSESPARAVLDLSIPETEAHLLVVELGSQQARERDELVDPQDLTGVEEGASIVDEAHFHLVFGFEDGEEVHLTQFACDIGRTTIEPDGELVALLLAFRTVSGAEPLVEVEFGLDPFDDPAQHFGAERHAGIREDVDVAAAADDLEVFRVH